MGHTPTQLTSTPAGWTDIPEEVHIGARRAALAALDEGDRPAAVDVPPAADRLAAYYDPAGNYAGSTFLDLEPHDPNVFTVADLHALTLLSVPVDPRSTRRFLEFGPHRQRLARLLADLPPDAEIAYADEALLMAMNELHEEVMLTLAPTGKEKTSEKWVRAAKLCARKRPNLFPVRDEVVRQHLQTLHYGSRKVDYLVFRRLLQDDAVLQAIADLHARVRRLATRGQPDLSALRVLDVALWTYGTWNKRRA